MRPFRSHLDDTESPSREERATLLYIEATALEADKVYAAAIAQLRAAYRLDPALEAFAETLLPVVDKCLDLVKRKYVEKG